MTGHGPEVERFRQLLEEEGSAWAVAKLDAFERLCEAFPGRDGPPPAGLRQIQRGQFDGRLHGDWKAVFVEVYQQWLGLRTEREADAESLPGRLGIWARPFPGTDGLPRPLRWLARPVIVVLLLTTWAAVRESRALTARANAGARLHSWYQVGLGQQDSLRLAEEDAMRRLVEATSESDYADLLATSPILRSRRTALESWSTDAKRALTDAELVQDAWRIPGLP